MPTPTNGWYAKNLDSLTSKIVRARGICENPKCQQAGWQEAVRMHSPQNEQELEQLKRKFWSMHLPLLQWAHIIPRGYRQVRWDEDNALCLCKSCHMYFTHRPLEWENFLLEVIGLERYQSLRRRALQYHDKIDLPALYAQKQATFAQLSSLSVDDFTPLSYN